MAAVPRGPSMDPTSHLQTKKKKKIDILLLRRRACEIILFQPVQIFFSSLITYFNLKNI
jgi:hypothetical protein